MKLFWGLNEIRTHTTGLLNRSSTIITIRPDWYGNSVVWRLSAVYRRSAYQIYLLNYTIKVIIISLAVVFHLTSSVSVFCMLLYQYVKDRFFTISPFYWLFCNFNIEISCLFFKYCSKNFQLFSILFCWAYGTRTHNSRTKILRVTITPKPNI